MLNKKFSYYGRKQRKFLLILLDLFLVSISIITSFWFLNADSFISNFDKYKIFEIIILNLIVCVPVYFYTGHYKGITRFIGSTLLYQFTLRNFFIITFLFLVTNSLERYQISIKLWILIFVFETLLTTSIRFLFRDILTKAKLLSFKKNTVNIIIYGAGSAGSSLASYIARDNRYKIAGFIDDNPELWNREIKGVEIFNSNKLGNLIKEKSVEKIFFAIPSIQPEKYQKILLKLQKYKIEVLKVPSFNEITRGGERVNKLRPISIEDLLMRSHVKTSSKLLGENISNKCILISGAGGSIGSELCRQILKFNPKKIILLEQNEPSLYLIYEELKSLIKDSNVKLEPILGNACEDKFLLRVFKENNINIIFHAAAHKHVPMVEKNPIEGLKNNILSTLTLAQISFDMNIDKFTLISSDKAVRPTSIMGASKRVSELIIKKFSFDISKNKNNPKYPKTIFSMVRFGNVLNSSGSVIPLFQKQIARGGPVTITHPEITRYFMTISEAVELVLQSSSFSDGGEVFLLDMGECIKITELAEQLINLSGYKVKKNNQEGIEIVFTGLRPGEKLYEELLVDSKAENTIHPLIFKSKENNEFQEDFNENIQSLLKALKEQNETKSLYLLSQLVKEWATKDLNKKT